MSFANLKQTHPKSFKLYTDFLKESFIQSQKGKATEELINNLFTDAFIMLSLERHGRTLYDFFDHFGIFISIWYSPSSWMYSINDGVKTTSSGINRRFTEEKAFLEAFNRLENK